MPHSHILPLWHSRLPLTPIFPVTFFLRLLCPSSFRSSTSLLHRGSLARATAGTMMNARSSRSHAIFTMYITHRRAMSVPAHQATVCTHHACPLLIMCLSSSPRPGRHLPILSSLNLALIMNDRTTARATIRLTRLRKATKTGCHRLEEMLLLPRRQLTLLRPPQSLILSTWR